MILWHFLCEKKLCITDLLPKFVIWLFSTVCIMIGFTFCMYLQTNKCFQAIATCVKLVLVAHISCWLVYMTFVLCNGLCVLCKTWTIYTILSAFSYFQHTLFEPTSLTSLTWAPTCCFRPSCCSSILKSLWCFPQGSIIKGINNFSLSSYCAWALM